MARSNALLAAELKELGGLGTDELRERWTAFYGMAPSPRISRELLIRAVAHRMQEEAHGGLGKSCRRQLARLAVALGEGGTIEVPQSRSFKPGTKLIREWKGRVHEVVIAGGTYIWAGQHYRSLSQIARDITGTRWSGPRFFGLEAGRETGSPAGARATTEPDLNGSRRRTGTGRAGSRGAADGQAEGHPVCGLYPQVVGGGPGTVVQLPARPAGGL